MRQHSRIHVILVMNASAVFPSNEILYFDFVVLSADMYYLISEQKYLYCGCGLDELTNKCNFKLCFVSIYIFELLSINCLLSLLCN